MGSCCVAQGAQLGGWSVMTLQGGTGFCVGGRFKREGWYLYISPVHVVQQKPRQHCKSIILKKKKNLRDQAGGRQPGAGIILQPSPTLAHICPSSLFHPVCSPVRDRSISLYPSITSNNRAAWRRRQAQVTECFSPSNSKQLSAVWSRA